MRKFKFFAMCSDSSRTAYYAQWYKWGITHMIDILRTVRDAQLRTDVREAPCIMDRYIAKILIFTYLGSVPGDSTRHAQVCMHLWVFIRFAYYALHTTLCALYITHTWVYTA